MLLLLLTGAADPVNYTFVSYLPAKHPREELPKDEEDEELAGLCALLATSQHFGHLPPKP